MQDNKKRFIGLIATSSFLFLIFKSIFGGILYACAAFFTKLKLEKWFKK